MYIHTYVCIYVLLDPTENIELNLFGACRSLNKFEKLLIKYIYPLNLKKIDVENRTNSCCFYHCLLCSKFFCRCVLEFVGRMYICLHVFMYVCEWFGVLYCNFALKYAV